MAKKRPSPPESQPIPPTTKPKDRHKNRKMLGIPSDIHRQLVLLARHTDRPMSRELRTALIKHLQENGFWPPE